MRKKIIFVPKGIKYLTEIKQIESPKDEGLAGIKNDGLPNGVFNKGITNCGATTMALEDKYKTIIASPRNNLLINKNAQCPGTFLVIGGVKGEEIKKYIASVDIPKILVSYDSFHKLLDCIEDKTEWRVVMDEFQYLLLDSSFKSEVELKVLENLKEFPYVTYLSATPILDKYIEQIPFFKEMDYYQLEWEEKDVVKIQRTKTFNPIAAALEIIKCYKGGCYPNLQTGNGKIYYSTECVIFLNSVTNIVNIINQSGLKSEEVNIIVGSTEDNDILISKIGMEFKRGSIPLKGEKHKMFTFCTSTAFAGCDFYSTCATTFVISDCNRPNTSIDISTDLVQIAGRQRLECNPFRRFLYFIYNTNVTDISKEEFEESLAVKRIITEQEIANNNEAPKELKFKRIKDILKEQRMKKFQDSYTMYNKAKDQFVFNDLAYLSDRYGYDVQMCIYVSGAKVKKELEDNEFDVSENQLYEEFSEQLKCIITRNSFVKRMKDYCDYKDRQTKAKGMLLNFEIGTIEFKYPEVKCYYERLGGRKIKSLGYKENNLKKEILAQDSKNRICGELGKKITDGERITTENIKRMLSDTYQKYGIKKAAKATDLKNLYGFDMHECKIRMDDGSRKKGWEIKRLK